MSADRIDGLLTFEQAWSGDRVKWWQRPLLPLTVNIAWSLPTNPPKYLARQGPPFGACARYEMVGVFENGEPAYKPLPDAPSWQAGKDWVEQMMDGRGRA